jgi:RimJ/RimL family protein N-acetyltransferase
MRRVVTDDQAHLRGWITGVLGMQFSPYATFIGQEIDGEVKAVVAFDNILDKSCMMHTAAIVPNWISKDLLWACFDYPFNILKVKVILASVASTNTEALKLDRHLGFVDKAYIEDAHIDGDLVILAMRRENCRWLDIKTPLKGD